MTTNDLYQAAVANRDATGERYGVARKTLPSGEVIVCSITTVAGVSRVRKHSRVEFGLIGVGEQYAKRINRTKAATLLRGE